MSYDLEIAPNHLPPKASPNRSLSSHGIDLEAIVTLLELAALSLTHKPGDTFDFGRLLSEARDIGGEEIEINETDVEIVLDKATFLKKEKKGQYCLK